MPTDKGPLLLLLFGYALICTVFFILLRRAAKTKGRSVHWQWCGLNPIPALIALLILRILPPLSRKSGTGEETGLDGKIFDNALFWGVMLIPVVAAVGGPVCLGWGWHLERKLENAAGEIQSLPATVVAKPTASDYGGGIGRRRGMLRVAHWLAVRPSTSHDLSLIQVTSDDWSRYSEGSEITVWTQPASIGSGLSLEYPEPQSWWYKIGWIWTFATIFWPLSLYLYSRRARRLGEEVSIPWRLAGAPAALFAVVYAFWPVDMPKLNGNPESDIMLKLTLENK